MTSSLVGSEMCIRDSPWSLSGGATAPRTTRLAPPARRRRHSGGSGGATACLLYTSDAADDM
eukprot:10897728-Prorocentrum_lima.AAC.1